MLILNFIKRVLSFPVYDRLTRNQKAKFLHVTLMLAFVVFLALAYLNYYYSFYVLGNMMSAIAVLSLFGLYLNYKKKFIISAIFSSIIVYIAIFFNLYTSGTLYDSGSVALPVYLIFTSFMFKKRSIFYVTVLLILSCLFLFFLEQNGIIQGRLETSIIALSAIIILLIATAGLLYVRADIWEKNLARLLYSQQEVREAYDMTLFGWSNALDLKDHETEGHSRRVVELSLALGKKMDLSQEELLHLQRGALLHDVGKIGIPDNILLKPGQLTEEEREIMQKHPTLAKHLLKDIAYLKKSIEIPYSHHEMWDGSGYPQGLKGTQIPIAARIFTIVYVWDALISDRPYRKAWPKEKVVAFIKENSGTMFEPRVVDNFLEIV